MMDIQDQLFVIRGRLAADRAQARAENAAPRGRRAGSYRPVGPFAAGAARSWLGHQLVRIGSAIAGEPVTHQANHIHAAGRAAGSAVCSAER